MIEIVVENDTITATGHANFNTKGKDIVCAGVSAIIENYKLYDNPSKDVKDFVYFSLCNIAETYPDYVSVIKR